MNEMVVTFGEDSHLVGTLTEPETPNEIGFLLLNAGVLHRVGPHRFNVKLARFLSRKGHTVLRFDLSGQGDSLLPRQQRPYHQQAVVDILAAMDDVSARTGVRRFVIAGICSGANNGLNAALQDERVAGLVMIDGHAYPNWRTFVLYYAGRLFSRSPADVIRTAVSKLRRGAAEKRRLAQATAQAADTPYAKREAYAQSMQMLVDRGTRVFILYTNSWSRQYNHASQLSDVFGKWSFVKHVRCQFAREFDHTFTLLESQHTVADWISLWSAEFVTGPKAPA